MIFVIKKPHYAKKLVGLFIVDCFLSAIHIQYIIPATPEEVYLALTTETTLLLWTGDKAVMGTVEGSEFSLWDGNIIGRNLHFEGGRRLVQHWYFGGQDADSIVTITLHPHKSGTSMEVRQTNIPDSAYDDITEGWDSEYAASLIDFYTG